MLPLFETLNQTLIKRAGYFLAEAGGRPMPGNTHCSSHMPE